jgi:hypothetical protein
MRGTVHECFTCEILDTNLALETNVTSSYGLGISSAMYEYRNNNSLEK